MYRALRAFALIFSERKRASFPKEESKPCQHRNDAAMFEQLNRECFCFSVEQNAPGRALDRGDDRLADVDPEPPENGHVP